jgi:hypothetical protein
VSLIGWVLAAIVASILLTLFALPWLSVFRIAMKARSNPTSPAPAIAELAAELKAFAAKHPAQTDKV